MNAYRIDFAALPWEERRAGVRDKTFEGPARVVRLVEFLTAEGFDGWCQQGHIGYVLAGGLTIDFNGEVVSFGAGDGLFIPDGPESQHRAVTIVPGTRLLMIEERISPTAG